MQKYFNSVTNRAGLAMSNVLVSVTVLGGPAAVLYSDNGVTIRTFPLLTDANGYYEFYAADGHYNITLSGASIGTITIIDIFLTSQVSLVSGTNIRTINGNTLLGSTDLVLSGTGGVSSVSVVSANGLAGTVATPTTTPAITLSTSVTGVLKGLTGGLVAAINSDLPAMSATVGGAVPTPPNNTTTFLRGDGTFAIPPGGGGTGTVTSVSQTVPGFLTVTGSPITTTGTLAIAYSGTALPIVNGGTGAITAPAALTSLGAQATLVSGTNLRTVNGNTLLGSTDIAVGYLNIPQNSQSVAYTTVLSDQGKHILHPSADTTARIFTIDSNATVAYPIGTALTFVNQNAAGAVTIAITTDTMRLAGAGTVGSRTLAANGIATAVKLTATEWIISGTGVT